jgi:hypothetical protein
MVGTPPHHLLFLKCFKANEKLTTFTYQGQLVSGNLEGDNAFEVGRLLVKNQLVVGLECGDDLRTHGKKNLNYIDLY